MFNKNLKTKPGFPIPLGANVKDGGVQFAIFSRNASEVILVLFQDAEPESKFIELNLDSDYNKTGDIWHIWIKGLTHGQLYGYRIDGKYAPIEGNRFNKNKLLIDPYARAITDNFKWNFSHARGYDANSSEGDFSFSDTDSAPFVPKSIVIDNRIDLNDRQLKRASNETIIYELHVRGFTKDKSSKTTYPGTYKGLAEKIPYLQELGITAIELLPIQEFDEFENININPKTGEKLKNFWGYSTLAFFAPKGTYAFKGTMGEQITEFKEMVKAFHDADIEVILDVVFNHTSEGDEHGPTISFRGIDNQIYYLLEDNKRFYKNYSGCGNTFNCNHPLVREFILDCLRYWVIEMKIDGFRFDLASILGRDVNGDILSNPPLIERIEEDPILKDTKIIAEAWDAAGAYQVGEFPGRWAEWNGKFRDDVRKFWRGDKNSSGNFATRFTGSSDLYQAEDRHPCTSINFITSHDGFTMNDLVSFNSKNNEENGEENRDGENNNYSYNWGKEGLKVDSKIEKIRLRVIKNFLATLFLSQGTPMIRAGDEFRKTQYGNNNSYCQDNKISWIDWNLLEKNSDLFRFVKRLIFFRKSHPILTRCSFFTGKQQDGFTTPDIVWLDKSGKETNWSEDNHFIALLINGFYATLDDNLQDNDLFIIFNAEKRDSYFSIPKAPNGKQWKKSIDTSKEWPNEVSYIDEEKEIDDEKLLVKKLSTIVLIA